MHSRSTAQRAVRTMAFTDMVEILDASVQAYEDGDFWLAFELDNLYEDHGGHSDNRSTCWSCKTWATVDHDIHY